MRRQSSENVSPSDLWPDFWKSVDVFSIKGKIEPISYDSYKKDVFGPGLQKIANARADSSPSIDQILKSDPNSDPKSNPRQKYSPFKAGRILNLMNKFPDEASHQDLYMEALDCVLESVTRLYPPHHIFGGASLTGAEANSFITHECLTALTRIAEVLEKRAEEHKAVSDLIVAIDKWCTDPDDCISRVHANSFSVYLHDQLSRLENPVGLTPVVQSLGAFGASLASNRVENHCPCLGAGLWC